MSDREPHEGRGYRSSEGRGTRAFGRRSDDGPRQVPSGPRLPGVRPPIEQFAQQTTSVPERQQRPGPGMYPAVPGSSGEGGRMHGSVVHPGTTPIPSRHEGPSRAQRPGDETVILGRAKPTEVAPTSSKIQIYFLFLKILQKKKIIFI